MFSKSSPFFDALRHRGRTFWAAALFIPCFAATASAPGDREEAIFLDDIPVVLSASRLSQPINEAPVAVTVIDHQMIRDSGAWDLSEIFRLVPGMYVAYHADPYFSADSTVAYHGMVTTTTSDRMQVLIDGRSVYAGLFGGVNWNDLPIVIADIERIEVVRGPDSASYGANSYLGVINIITRHAAESQGGSVSLTGGRSRSEGVFRYGGKSGDLSYRITASLRKDNGEDDYIHNPTSQNTFWTLNKFDNKTMQIFNLRTDYQINASDTLEFQFGFNGGPREVGEYKNVSAITRQAENHFEMLNWRRALDGDGELAIKAFHTSEKVDATLRDSDGISDGDIRFNRFDLEVQHTFSPFQDGRLVWGGSVRYDKTYAPYYLGVGDNQYLYGEFPFHLQRLFGNLEWRVRPDVIINTGAMLEHNSYTGNDVTPRIAANWHVTPEHTFRISHSRATRSPSVYEKVYEAYWRGPDFYPALPELRPERVQSTEIGYMGKVGKADIDFRIFYDDYHDLIDVRKAASAASGNLNAGRALMRGYELQLKAPMSDKTRIIYGLSGGGVKSDNINGVIYSDSLPKYNHSLMLSHTFSESWQGSLVAYQIAKTKFNATDYNPTQNRGYYIDGNRRLDGRLNRQFLLAGKHAEVTLVVQNMLNAHYFEYRHDNEFPGRLARLNFKLDF
ncbi:TonB-dependent receptor plug domain-containing protein [Undibacterium oligocarboniphilum]|uniref:TonB-dependent receptor n=1 Tax=Undibacterium oligocarboniphilum TaxID=666702 RepID=A0A850QI47_9BURK|nr:TonB-dependent receptor [Undibacterium oligocarboniphilum]MBC3869093.1 TonB-dependent receptor [Undibacterium oligocarboniphilum]NVO77073.1 TonB-dependent receptor [Undibacterium oligocarboniphilum]